MNKVSIKIYMKKNHFFIFNNFTASKFHNIINKHTALSAIRLKVITSHVFNIKWIQQEMCYLV